MDAKKFSHKTTKMSLFVGVLVAVSSHAALVDLTGGNFEFNTDAPNPRTTALVAPGGSTITFLENAGLHIAAGPALTLASGGYTVTLQNGSSINGGLYGVLAADISGPGVLPGLIENTGGSIQGGEAGIWIEDVDYDVVNTGTVSGKFGIGYQLNSTGDVTNNVGGQIVGGVGYFQGATGTVDNRGSITSDYEGIVFDNAGTITNTGSITGSGQFIDPIGGPYDMWGVYIGGGALEVSSVTNTGGTIQGLVGAGGVYIGQGTGVTVTNQSGGTIGGASGDAIVFGAGLTGGTVELETGATTTGAIRHLGDSTGATFRLFGAGGSTLDGDTVFGFGDGQLVKDGAGEWILTGDNAFNATAVNAGHLIIGDGGTTGSLTGDVTVAASASLRFNRSDDSVFSDVISGDGEFRKLGGGTLTLTGTNTPGVITVQAGALQVGDGGTAGSITGNVVLWTGTTLAFNKSSTITSYGDVISGTGLLQKLGTGILQLSGANTYTGGTTISAGTLQIGSGASGSIVGDVAIAENALLDFNRTNNLTFGGVISGDGALSQSAAGELTLSGVNTYTGGTTVSAGALRGTTTSLQGAIANNASLYFDQVADGTYAGVLTGSGTLYKTEAGTLTLTGNSGAYAGTTQVNVGTLHLNNASLGGNVQVASDLTGVGTVGGNLIGLSGGAIAPGNSIGTINVLGDFELQAGSLLGIDVQVSPSLTSDLLNVTGSATLANNSTILVDQFGPGTLAGTEVFTIINAGGGVTDNGATINSAIPTIRFAGDISGTNYNLVAELIESIIWESGTGNWSDAGNWDHDDGIGLDVGGLVLEFNNAAGGTSTADGGNYTNIGGIEFADGAGWYTLTGQPLGFVDGGGIANFSGRDQVIENEMIVAAGGLILNSSTGDLLMQGPIDLTSGGDLTVTGGSSLATRIDGIINGSGGIIKQGDGMLTLFGENTYTGGTTVSNGTLRLGGANRLLTTGVVEIAAGGTFDLNSNNQTLGGLSGSGDVALGTATLTVNSNDDGAYGGVISGIGGLTKGGTGTYYLTGENTYSGQTNVNVGTLVIGGGGTSGSIAGNLQTGAGATSEFWRSDNMDYNGILSGSGTVRQTGSGMLTLSGNSSGFGGTTHIDAGILNLVDSLGGTLNIQDGGTLMGTGTLFGNLFSLSGSTFAPGASIGTINVSGDWTVDSGSIIEIEVGLDGGGNPISDLINVTGTATLNGGTVRPIVLDSGIQKDDVFTFLQATTIAGTGFDHNPGDLIRSGVYQFSLDYTPTTAFLTLERLSYTEFAQTGNARSVADALDSAAAGGLDILPTTLNDAQITNALQSISPEPYRAMSIVPISNAQLFASTWSQWSRRTRPGFSGATGSAYLAANRQPMNGNAIANDFGAHSDPGMAQSLNSMQDKSGFLHGVGQYGRQDSGTDRTGFSYSSGGVAGGIDRNVSDNMLVGLGVGYMHSDIRYHLNRGKGYIDSFRFGPYMAYSKDKWHVDGSISGGLHCYDMSRRAAIGANTVSVKSDYNGYDLSMHLGAAYDLHVKDWVVSPGASFHYTYLHQESFTERGDSVALAVNSQDTHSFRSLLGLAATTQIRRDNITYRPHLSAGWAYEFADNGNDITARFADAPSSSFVVRGQGLGRNSGLFGGGLTADLPNDVSAFVRYQAELHSNTQTHTFMGGVSWKF